MSGSSQPLMFQIGPNKCATSALFKLFQNSGHPSLHSSGSYWKRRDGKRLRQANPQFHIHENIEAGRAPLDGVGLFQAHFDMECKIAGLDVENYKRFDVFARAYPNAKFLLNTREKVNWLRSRLRHADGRYLTIAKRKTGLDTDAVLHLWSDEFDRHGDAVRTFFASEADRLVQFNTDTGDIAELIEAVAPDFTLDATRWLKIRVTDQVAEKKAWKDILGEHRIGASAT